MLKKLLFILSFSVTSFCINSAFAESVSVEAFFTAIENGNYNEVKTWVDRGFPLSITYKQSTPLSTAVQNNDYEITKLFLDQGAQVDQADGYGNSPICYSYAEKNDKISGLLLDRGANQDASCDYKYYETAEQKAKREQKILGLQKNVAATSGAIILVGGGIAIAASSGGGGGGGGSGASTQVVTLGPKVTGYGTTGDYEDTEYYYSGDGAGSSNTNALAGINASSAYARGYSGLVIDRTTDPLVPSVTTTEVRIGLVDNGIDVDHTDLDDNIYAYDGFDASPDVTRDDSQHGTHVAGIMVAESNDVGMHGVAFDAELVSYQASNSTTITLTNAAAGIDYCVAQSAVVINNSYGQTADSSSNAAKPTSATDYRDTYVGSTFVTSILAAAANDVVLVFSAGNDGYTESSVLTAAPLFYSELSGLFINVIGLNATNDAIATTADGGWDSNQCGVTKNYCLAAPGTSIYSTITTTDGGSPEADDYTYDDMSGTSMAAPHVTGGIALLLGAFPNLNAQDAVNILFETATDLGDAGIDDVYGRGLMNLNAATTPSSEITIPVSSASAFSTASQISLADSSISTTALSGSALNSTNLRFMFLDKWDRSFYTDVSKFISEPDRVDAGDTLNKFINKDFAVSTLMQKNKLTGKKQSWSFYKDSTSNEIKSDNISGFGYTNSLLSLNYSRNLSQISGDENLAVVNEGIIKNPYKQFAESGFTSSFNKILNNSANLKFEFTDADMGDVYGGSKMNIVSTELNISPTKSKNLNLSFESGLLREKETFLGMHGEGMFEFATNTNTNFFSLSGDYNIGSATMFADYGFGISKPEFENELLFTDISTVYSDSFNVGGYYKFNKGLNKVGAVVSQPLRVRSGHIDYNAAVDRDYDADVLMMEQGEISLVPNSRELDLQAFYALDETKFGDFKFAYMYKINPEHNSQNPNESVFMINLRNKF